MPNHVTNELIFRGLSPEKRSEMLANIVGPNGIDFGILVPIPMNCWMGSVGERHEKAFKHTALDWCRENWGTKWNAYGEKPIEEGDELRIVFDTAWRPPYGWLAAVFNRFKVSFDHNWLDEGESHAHADTFDYAEAEKDFGEPWKQSYASEAEYRRLHKIKWGVEQFDDETEEAPKPRSFRGLHARHRDDPSTRTCRT